MEAAINIINEIWKDITGYEGLYQISNYGNVKSLAKSWITGTGKGRICEKPETILKAGTDTYGYFYVYLSKSGKAKTYMIHHLVWDAFGDKSRNGHKLQVDHQDEDKKNNKINNLQLLTNRENRSKSTLFHKTNGLPVGVHQIGNKFCAQIKINGKCIYLGLFKHSNDASMAYQKAIYANQ